MWIFRSFPQENEKNNRATLISVKLISVALGSVPVLKQSGTEKNSVSRFFARLRKKDAPGVFDGREAQIEELTVLFLRELVLFPQTMVPIFITYKSGIAALEEALRRDLRLFAVCIRRRTSAGLDEPWPAGTVMRIVQHLKLPDNTFRVVLQGEYRGILKTLQPQEGFSLARIVPITAEGFADPPDSEDSALLRSVRHSFIRYAELSKKINTDAISAVERAENPERLANLICNAVILKPEKKVELLAISGARDRLLAVLESLELENEIFGIQKNISGKIKNRMAKNHREYILQEQLREINRELGNDKTEDEFVDLETSIAAKNPPPEVTAKAAKEIARLRKLQPLSPEAGVLRGYLEWIRDLPWSECSSDTGTDAGDLDSAERILNADHFNMRKAKDRILEFIAVRQLSQARLPKPRARLTTARSRGRFSALWGRPAPVRPAWANQ